MSRILVVYYSRTGTTRQVGESITAALRSDSEEIVEATGRGGKLGYLRSLFEAMLKVPSRVVAARQDPSNYDLVVIGTPVWAWSVSSPIRTYLAANKPRLSAVALFCTMGGAGSDRAFAQMQELAGQRPAACLAIKAGDVALANYGPELEAFVEALQQRLPSQPDRTTNAA